MFSYKIHEIAAGSSKDQKQFDSTEYDFDLENFKSGSFEMQFTKDLQMIQVDVQIDAVLKLVCDRSLETYEEHISGEHQILYKENLEEEVEEEGLTVRHLTPTTKKIDFADIIRDTLLLNIPIKKIHPKYLDDEGNVKDFEVQSFGVDPNEQPEEIIDQRWSKLKELKDKTENL